MTTPTLPPSTPPRRLLFPRPTLRGVWLGMLLLYSAACIILPIIWKGVLAGGRDGGGHMATCSVGA